MLSEDQISLIWHPESDCYFLGKMCELGASVDAQMCVSVSHLEEHCATAVQRLEEIQSSYLKEKGAYMSESAVKTFQKECVSALVWRCCLNCEHWSKEKDLCALYNQRPPANVIVFADCPSYAIDLPF